MRKKLLLILVLLQTQILSFEVFGSWWNFDYHSFLPSCLMSPFNLVYYGATRKIKEDVAPEYSIVWKNFGKKSLLSGTNFDGVVCHTKSLTSDYQDTRIGVRPTFSAFNSTFGKQIYHIFKNSNGVSTEEIQDSTLASFGGSLGAFCMNTLYKNVNGEVKGVSDSFGLYKGWGIKNSSFGFMEGVNSSIWGYLWDKKNMNDNSGARALGVGLTVNLGSYFSSSLECTCSFETTARDPKEIRKWIHDSVREECYGDQIGGAIEADPPL